MAVGLTYLNPEITEVIIKHLKVDVNTNFKNH